MKFYSIIGFITMFFYGQSAVSQIDIFDYKFSSISSGIRHSSYNNYYAVIPHSIYYGNFPNGTKYSINDYVVSDKGSGYNLHLNHLKFEENSVIDASNAETVLYYMWLGLNGKFQSPEEAKSGKLFSTRSDQLSKSNAYNGTLDFTLSSRFWNHNAIDISAFGGKHFLIGANLVFKQIGLNGEFTYYDDYNPDATQKKEYVNLVGNIFDTRVLLGPALGYRTNIGDKVALYSKAGVNFCANLANKERKLNNNLYGCLRLYYGKSAGLFLGANYDLTRCTYTYGAFLGSNMVNGSPIKMKASTYEFHIGFYYQAGALKRLFKS